MHLLVEYFEKENQLKVVSEDYQFALDLREIIITSAPLKELFGRDTYMYIYIDEENKQIEIEMPKTDFFRICEYEEMSADYLFRVICMISPDMKAAHPISNEYSDDFFEDDMSVYSPIDGLLENYDGTSEDYVLDENGQWIKKQGDDEQETEKQGDGTREMKEKCDAEQETEKQDAGQKPTQQDAANMYKDRVYAKPLCDYLKNIRNMIETAGKMGTPATIWSQALLLSIDDGYGVTTFLKNLSDIYRETGVLESKVYCNIYSEWHLEYLEKKPYDDWARLIEALDDIKGYKKDEGKLVSVTCIDLSNWIIHLNTPELRSYMRKLADREYAMMFVFRLPYMEKRVVMGIEKIIADSIGVRSLIVPSISVEQMVDYLYKKAETYGYTLDESRSDVLERGIISEKNDGYFYGYKSLNKMLETIIYEKIAYNASRGLVDKYITAGQLQSFLKLEDNEPSVDEMFAKLVGIDDIRNQLENVVKQIALHKSMLESGKKVERPGIHMLFTGNPGTGKTTVARIVAKMLKEAGILSKGYLYEIKGRDLCGQYIGETTPKTCGYCRDAYGSVLFIDEAYQLCVKDSDRDYGREAITALVAEMENHRDDMCVILAGYADDMEDMMKLNAGLADRVPIKIEFPNYTREQLNEIFFKMMEGKFGYEEELKDEAHRFFENLPDSLLAGKDFGNARFVRNLYERVWRETAARYGYGGTDNIVITKKDFINAVDKINLDKYNDIKPNTIGF